MTFNRHVKDFEFYVNYGDLGFLSDFELQALGSLNITKISVQGLESTIQKNMDEKTDYKGVKAHFRMDESGILNLEEVESVFEKAGESESKLESAFAKLGDTIGRLFSGKSEEQPEEEKKTESETPKDEEVKKANDTAQEETKENATTQEVPKNDTKPVPEPKLQVVREPLTAEQIYLDLTFPTSEDIEKSIKKLIELDEHDRAVLERAKTKNSLESFIVETKDKLSREEYEKASTEDERSNIMKSLTESSDWLEYESDEASTETFKTKLSDLRELTKSLFERVKEHHERPEVLKILTDMLNAGSGFLASARNRSEDEQIFTEVELKTLDNLVAETKIWYQEMVAEQELVPLHEAPKLTLKLISEKMVNLDREVKYLLNKARFAQPLKKKTAQKETKANDTAQNVTEKEIPGVENATTEAETPGTTEESVQPIEIPEIANNIEEGETNAGGEGSSQKPETPSPDKVQEDPHTEL